ncbi:hypothetical protein J6590_056113 [Homalodisca vitripennis]|nr:hypothetical protein J6590_056113 [Homalodisca vitripennis]
MLGEVACDPLADEDYSVGQEATKKGQSVWTQRVEAVAPLLLFDTDCIHKKISVSTEMSMDIL